MISDRTLLKISVSMSIAGILAIFLLVSYAQPVKTSHITENMTGTIVEMSGNISSLVSRDGNVFIDMDGTRIVIFRKQASKNPWVYEMDKGDMIAVIGKVSVYKGVPEVIAEEIKAF